MKVFGREMKEKKLWKELVVATGAAEESLDIRLAFQQPRLRKSWWKCFNTLNVEQKQRANQLQTNAHFRHQKEEAGQERILRRTSWL